MRFHLRVMDLSDPKRARAELEAVGADPAGVGKMLQKAGYLALRASAVRSPGANILKQEALSVGAEAAVARGVINCSIDHTDVLILGTRKQLRALVRKLRPQPFSLKILAEEIEALLANLDRAFDVPWSGGVLHLSTRPHVMGVLNVTPDSFSDGGDHFDREAALDRALQMVEEGADIVDVGGESTRPGSDPVPPEVELARIVPILEFLAPRLKVPLSVDTYRADVAERAVGAGASMVNDISGLRADPEMAAAVARSGASVVLMHMRGTPKTMQTDTTYVDLVGEVSLGLEESAEAALAAGVPRNRIILDPGIGFGKSAQGNLELLARGAELRSLGFPILVGASRKSFIGKLLGAENPKDRLEGSLAAAVVALWNGAHILRVHDVRASRRALDLTWAMRTAASG
ncbi:MAG: dihydropteroate synthase [Deltaproteobacteria bacterium]|nr:dihydropteroate synthase [Deltaproteobacteria bacterium]